MKQNYKKIANTVLDVLVVLLLVVSLSVVVLSATAKKNGVSNMFGYTFLSVKTDSMEPTIMVGDLIIGRVSVSDAEYNVDDVVTFWQSVDGTMILNTHRIIKKELDGNTYYYTTKGDNASGEDRHKIVAGDVVATWHGTKIDGLGKVIDFLRTGTGFFIFLMLPVIIFFLYYLYKFIRSLSEYNKEKAVEAAKQASAEMDEAQKQKIIAEYLAAQKAQQSADADKKGTDDSDS